MKAGSSYIPAGPSAGISMLYSQHPLQLAAATFWRTRTAQNTRINASVAEQTGPARGFAAHLFEARLSQCKEPQTLQQLSSPDDMVRSIHDPASMHQTGAQ
jgi:hypothetical protein